MRYGFFFLPKLRNLVTLSNPRWRRLQISYNSVRSDLWNLWKSRFECLSLRSLKCLEFCKKVFEMSLKRSLKCLAFCKKVFKGQLRHFCVFGCIYALKHVESEYNDKNLNRNVFSVDCWTFYRRILKNFIKRRVLLEVSDERTCDVNKGKNKVLGS